MSRFTHVRRRDPPDNVEYLKLVETTVNIDEQVLCGLREDLVNLALTLPGVELDDSNPHETVRSAIAALRKIVHPEPVLSPEEQRAAKVAADTKVAVEDPQAFEEHRITAWAEHFHACEYGGEDYKKGDAIVKAWSSITGAYDLPDGLVGDGWPPNVDSPAAYIKKEMEWRHRPPGNETDDLPPEPDDEPEAPVETEMHRMLAAASGPVRPPAHD